jgi:signal peptidase II
MSLKKATLIIILILLIDQISKIYIKTNFALGEDFKVFDWFSIYFVENEGMAFGWALPGTAGKLLLTTFRILASVGIGVYLFRLVKDKVHIGMLRCVALIWAGAIGNIIDGAVYGQLFSYSSWSVLATFTPDGYAPFFMGNVVDMLHFTLHWPSWMPFNLSNSEVFPPIFNIADAAISIGVIWILIRQKTFFNSLPSKSNG